MKVLRVTKIIKKTKFEGIRDELESKTRFQKQSVTKYLRPNLVFGSNSRLVEKIYCYFFFFF